MAEEKKYTIGELKSFRDLFKSSTDIPDYLTPPDEQAQAQGITYPEMTDEKLNEVEQQNVNKAMDKAFEQAPEKKPIPPPEEKPIPLKDATPLEKLPEQTKSPVSPEDQKTLDAMSDERFPVATSQGQQNVTGQPATGQALPPPATESKQPLVPGAATSAENKKLGQNVAFENQYHQRQLEDLYELEAENTIDYRRELERQTEENAIKSQDQLDELLAVNQELKNYKFDPGRYFANMNTPQKLLASFALFLNGAGGGDEVMGFINKQLDMDMDYQEKERLAIAGQVNFNKTIYEMTKEQGLTKLQALASQRLLQIDWAKNQVLRLQAQFSGSQASMELKAKELSTALEQADANVRQTYLKTATKQGVDNAMLKRQKLEAEKRKAVKEADVAEQETRIVIGSEKAMNTDGSTVAQNIVVEGKNEKATVKASKEIQDYLFFNDVMNTMRGVASSLRKNPSLYKDVGFAKFMKSLGLVSKMKQRIDITGGGNVSNYEQQLLAVFEAFGFVKPGTTSLSQAYNYWTSPLIRYSMTKTLDQLDSLILTQIKSGNTKIKSNLKGLVRVSDFERVKNLNTDNLMRAYGYKTNYKILKTKSGFIVGSE